MSKVLITGAAGYIGQYLTRFLIEKGFQVRALDNLLYDTPLDDVDVEFIYGSINDPDTVNKAMKGMDSVIHLAAISNDPASDLDPRLSLMVNFEAIKILKSMAKKHGIERFIFSSSCSTYGAKGDKISNELSSLNPITLYGRLKVDAEKELMNGFRNSNFCPIILRNATAFGLSKRMRFDLAINLLTMHALKKNRLTIFGGDQWRPFVHIADISEAFYLCLVKPIELVRGEIFNVGSSRLNYKLASLIPSFKDVFPGVECEIDEAKTDKRSYRVDFSKIKEKLNFSVKYSIKDGMKEIKNAVDEEQFEDWEVNTKYYCVRHLRVYGYKKFPELMMNHRIYPPNNHHY